MKLIDTSAWIESLRTRGDKEIRSQVEIALRNGEARLTEPVLVELFHGAQGTKELNLLNSIKDSVPILECSSNCFTKAIQLSTFSRKKGITVSSMDILIFAVAKEYKADIIYKDRHFHLLESII